MKNAIQTLEFIRQHIMTMPNHYDISKIGKTELIYRIIIATTDYIEALEKDDLATEAMIGMAIYSMYQEAKKRFTDKDFDRLLKAFVKKIDNFKENRGK